MTAASILDDNWSKNVDVDEIVIHLAKFISQSQRFNELIHFTKKCIIFKCINHINLNQLI